MKKLLGQPVAEKIFQEGVLPYLPRSMSDRPHLAIILVGDDEASQKYIAQKEKVGRSLGITVSVYRFDSYLPVSKIEQAISFLNDDLSVDGLMIQLPLPDNFRADQGRLLNMISPAKDVDVLGQVKAKKVSCQSCNSSTIFRSRWSDLKERYLQSRQLIPPTAQAVMEMIDYYYLEPKRIAVLGRGILVGQPVVTLLDQLRYPYKVIHSRTKPAERQLILKESDLVICGCGRGQPIISSYDLYPKANVIDCAGDFDQNDIESWKGSVTPEVGGLGPVTVACLMKNLILAKRWMPKLKI